MFNNPPSIAMSPEEFRLLRDFICEYCGLYFSDEMQYLLERRLSRRVENLRLDSFKKYHQYLKYHRERDRELESIIDVLTTNETYFFREEQQLKAFIEEILPEIAERKKRVGDRTIRIWSAGCSTGEEPYTLAMLIMESFPWRTWKISIFGSDINQRALDAARRGVYGPSSFRCTQPRYIERYFSPQGGGQRIRDEVREFVQFGSLNLLDVNKVGLVRQQDIIFCRNVIIYFDLKTKRTVIEMLNDRLQEGGFLLLGHSESLINLSTAFKLRHLINDMVYQKPVLNEKKGPDKW